MARDSDYSLLLNATDANGIATPQNSPWNGTISAVTFGGWYHPGATHFNKVGLLNNYVVDGNPVVLLRHVTSAGGLFQGYIYDGSTQFGPSSVAASAVNKFYHVVYRWTGSIMKLRVDGVDGAEYDTSSAYTSLGAPTTPLRFGYASSSAVGASGYFRDWFWVERALSDDEIDELAAGSSPLVYGVKSYWPLDNTGEDLCLGGALTMGAAALFATGFSGERRIWAPDPIELIPSRQSSNGVTELTPEDSTVVLQTDPVVLSQTHELAPGDSVVTVASDTGTVTSTVTVIAEDSAVAVQSDSVPLAQTHVLTAEETVVEVASDQASLTQTHDLTPGDSAVVTQSDTGIVTGAVTLIGEMTTVLVQSDAGVLEQTHDLAPIKSVVATVIDASALGQVHQLAPASSVVDTVSDEATVTNTLTLVAEVMTVAVASDPGGLDQTHNVSGEASNIIISSDVATLIQQHALVPTDAVVAVQSDPGVVFQQSLGEITDPAVELLPGYLVRNVTPHRAIRLL